MQHFKQRDDAVWINNPRRQYVPTSDETKWVGNWEEFRAAGGVAHFSEDQTEVVLTLPAPYKFGIQFQRAER